MENIWLRLNQLAGRQVPQVDEQLSNLNLDPDALAVSLNNGDITPEQYLNYKNIMKHAKNTSMLTPNSLENAKEANHSAASGWLHAFAGAARPNYVKEYKK